MPAPPRRITLSLTVAGNAGNPQGLTYRTSSVIIRGMGSRELDALVAEKVLGWAWYGAYGDRYLIPPFAQEEFERYRSWQRGLNYRQGYPPYDVKPAKQRLDIETTFESFAHLAIPRFSTSIEAAWTVIEHLAQKQLGGHVGPTRVHRMMFCEGEWVVEFCSDFGVTKWAKDPAAPKAICLAALVAVGVVDELVTKT